MTILISKAEIASNNETVKGVLFNDSRNRNFRRSIFCRNGLDDCKGYELSVLNKISNKSSCIHSCFFLRLGGFVCIL